MRTWQRTTAGLLVAAVGMAFIVVVVVSRLFSVGPAFERMSTGFRPVMKPAPIARIQGDLKGMQAVSREFATTAVPLFSQALKMSPQQFSSMMGSQYPAVATGMQRLPAIVDRFNGVIGTLQAEQGRFASADAIPTASLPATTVPWGLLLAGVLLLGTGVVMVVRPGRVAPIVAVVLGLALVVTPLALSLIGKSSNADAMNRHLKPVYTAQMLAGSQSALSTIGAMGQQMQQQMLPGLGAQLGMDPAQVQSFLRTNLPATSAVMAGMPQAMGRFQSLLATFRAHLQDYDTLKPVAFLPIVWTMLIGGIVALVAGLWAGLLRASKIETAVVPEPSLARAA